MLTERERAIYYIAQLENYSRYLVYKGHTEYYAIHVFIEMLEDLRLARFYSISKEDLHNIHKECELEHHEHLKVVNKMSEFLK